MDQKSISDYKDRIDSLIADPEFNALNQTEKGITISKFRDEYSAGIEDPEKLKIISDLTTLRSDFIKGDRYRIDPESFKSSGLTYPELNVRTKEEALSNIESFRKQIDEKSSEFDPVFKDDYAFDLHRMADEEERKVRGQGVSRPVDLHNRYVKGFTGALMRGVGMNETADYLDLKFLPVNTENDEDFISKLATGGGDAVATMGLVLGASAVAGPEAGLAVGFATNATRKYQEAYKREFDLSGNTAIAHDAGLAATPGAALESIGEMLIAGKLGNAATSEFRQSFLKAATSEAKADVVREALKSSEFRRKVLAVGLSSQQEGFSEVGGDVLSAFGAGQVTGRDVMPTAKDNLETYAISSIIGVGFGGFEVGMSGLDPALKARQQELKDALARGDSQAVATIAQDSIIQTAPVNENTPTVPERPEPKLDTSTQEVADDGTISNVVPGGLQVDERTAQIHDRLVDYLTRGSTLDDLNALPPGKKKGERNNPNANNQRSVETGVQGMVEDQLDIELPERARVFAELDMATNNVNYEFSPEQIDATKRMIDSVALTAIQNGIEPDFVYKGLSFRNSLSAEEQKAAGRRGKPIDAQSAFNREFDFEAEKAKYGLQQQQFNQEAEALRSEFTPEQIEQTKKSSAVEHFDPELIERYSKKAFKSRETLVEMPIDDFLSLAWEIPDDAVTYSNQLDRQATSREHADALGQLINEGIQFDGLPEISVDEFAKGGPRVSGHEGRHRAKALKALGYETMPVIWRSGRIRWSEQTPGKFDYVEDFPVSLRNEEDKVTSDYPVNRDGQYVGLFQEKPADALLQSDQLNNKLDEKNSEEDFNLTLYHGTNDAFDTFDPDRYLTDRDQFSGPGINLTNSKTEASNYGSRIMELFVRLKNPAKIKNHIFELLTKDEIDRVNDSLEPTEQIVARRILDGSVERWGSRFIIKAKNRDDVGFLDNPPFEGKIDSIEKALILTSKIKDGTVDSVGYKYKIDQDLSGSYGTANRKAIEILKSKGYDGIVMEVSPEDTLHEQGATHYVVFDPDQVKNKSGDLLNQSDNTQGRIQFEDENGNLQPIEVPIDQLNNKLRGIITLMKRGANITTVHHELMHYYHRSGLLNKLLSPEELQGFEKAAGLQEDNIWREENYEAVARAYEGWLRNPQIIGEGKIRVPDILQRVFRKISSAFLNVYKSLKDSPLPSKESKSGKSIIPNIDPAFRLAFEKLYGFDPTLQLNNKLAQPNANTNTQSPVGPQLPSVNRQLTGGGQVVSPQQTQQSSTESQLTYEQDKDDKLNVKLIKSLKTKHRLDLKAQEAFKEVVELAAGLHNDPDLAGRFYALLDNFAISRKLNNSKDREQGLRSDLTDESVERANNATTKQAYVDALIKKGSDPAVTDNVIAELKTIRDAAFKLWFEQYKARFGKSMADANVEDFADKDAVIKYNAQKRQELAEQESDEEKISERRESINFNSAVAQAGLRLREDADMPGFDLPAGPLRDALFKYYEFLKRVDVPAITNDIEAFQIQHRLDALLNDDVVLGLSDFARHLAQIDLGRYSSNAKFRNPYAKFGLVMLMKRITGRDFSETFTGLDLASINIEKIAGNKAALDFLNETFMHEYYDAISKAEVVKKQFKDFLKASRLKHFGKLGADPVEMNRAGIISKIMQAPVDLDHDQVIQAIKNNVAQLRLGFENEKVHAGDDKHSGQLKIKLLDEVLAGLPEDFDQEQFIENAKRVAPKETALVLDVVGWIADNLTDQARVVTEGLYEKPFSPQSYYAPTQQVSLRPGDRNNDFELDGSFMADQYGNDAFKVKNPINVSKTGSLQERTGYLGNPEFNSFNTNFQYVMENTVDGVINDIYTGFVRRKIGYMLNTSKGGLYAQVKEILGGENLGADRVEHLRKTLSDMIFTDLAQHKYLNQLELFIGRVRQNISPALLSSLHQIITQPFSQSVAHVVRNRKILKYYPEAMKLAWQHTMNSAPAGFNVMFDRHLSERAPAPDYLLAKGQSLPRANPLDMLGGYIANQMGVEEKAFSKFVRGAKLVDGKIKDGLLWGLRHGDMASAKVIFAAELLAAADREQGITDSSKVEYERLSIKSLSDAVSVMDEAINASRNSRRGTILAHPGTVYSLLSIFAGHRISIAGATSLRVRNAIELSMDKNRKDGMLGDSARYVLATAMQSVAFSALKWGVLSMLIKGLYQALTPGEDDERHWLYGDLEKSEVDQLRKATQERYDTSFGPGTLKANIMRDMFGNIVMISAFAGADNFIFSLWDKFSENNFKEGQQEAVEQLQKRIQERAEFLSAAEIQELQKQIEVIKSTKHVDLAYKNFGIGILTGGVGASAQPMIDTINAAGDAMTSETKTYSIEDFVLLMRMFGYGQPELTRALKLVAAGKDSIQENRTKEEQSF